MAPGQLFQKRDQETCKTDARTAGMLAGHIAMTVVINDDRVRHPEMEVLIKVQKPRARKLIS